MAGQPMRVMLVEDHGIVRQGLAALLAEVEDIELVGEASDAETAVEATLALRPDVVVMDVSLGALDGIEATRRIARLAPAVQVVILSMYDDSATVERALLAGARGYLLKGGDIDGLCGALRRVRRGQIVLDGGVSHSALQAVRDGRAQPDPLTAREREVLHWIAQGWTSGQVAERLSLKTKTVQNHRTRIMEKLDLHTTAALVRYALQTGIAR